MDITPKTVVSELHVWVGENEEEVSTLYEDFAK